MPIVHFSDSYEDVLSCLKLKTSPMICFQS